MSDDEGAAAHPGGAPIQNHFANTQVRDAGLPTRQRAALMIIRYCPSARREGPRSNRRCTRQRARIGFGFSYRALTSDDAGASALLSGAPIQRHFATAQVCETRGTMFKSSVYPSQGWIRVGVLLSLKSQVRRRVAVQGSTTSIPSGQSISRHAKYRLDFSFQLLQLSALSSQPLKVRRSTTNSDTGLKAVADTLPPRGSPGTLARVTKG
ncbi:hypothetical protein FRB97_004621, partial [Tulasnella sp. 331]